MSGYSGMKAWLLQRFSGIYIALFALVMVYLMSSNLPLNYPVWKLIFGQLWMQIGSGLFVVALLLHAWIGLRDVILDYIHPIGVKLMILTLAALMLIASGLWFLRVLFMVEIV